MKSENKKIEPNAPNKMIRSIKKITQNVFSKLFTGFKSSSVRTNKEKMDSLEPRTEENKNDPLQFTRYFWNLGERDPDSFLIPKLIPALPP